MLNLDERPDLSTAEIKLKSQIQMKSKKKNRLKSRNASMEKNTDEEKEKKMRSDTNTSLHELTNIVISTAAQYVSSIRYFKFFDILSIYFDVQI